VCLNKEWYLSDYKRRVSSTATVNLEALAIYSDMALVGFTPHKSRSDILGLAAGGRMYGSFDSTLLFVSLILEQSAEYIP
jgi:hypothetical protein